MAEKKLNLTWEEYEQMRQRKAMDDLYRLIEILDEYFKDSLKKR
jgi:hypothetical protein